MSDSLAAELEAARRRTLSLLAPLDDAELVAQHSVLMSPLVWDLAHVGNYEDQWLLRSLGAPGVGPQHDDVYDAFRHPRAGRPSLPLLGPAAAHAYIAEVRERVLERGVTDDFVFRMVVQHEHQHDETMLATLQLMDGAYPIEELRLPRPRYDGPAEVCVEGGPFVMGTDADPWAYDNERPAHVVDLPSFWIDAVPVTVGAYLEFVEDGGYDRPEFWSEDGWKWRQSANLTAPEFWGPDRTRRRFGLVEPLVLDEPVQHVCWYEAEAYACFVGKRLPTEAEWEKAAAGSTVAGANLGQRRFGPAPVGGGAPSEYGCCNMLGDVWEWTASSFHGYPGFRSFPYREYSEVFFGEDYKVLRGGSWATDPVAVRTTFRNWDYPIRRQIFAGFRCARDA